MPPADRPSGDFARQSGDAVSEQFRRTKMHPLAERITRLQQSNDLFGESLDHGYFEPKAEILHFGGERSALVEQPLGPRGKQMQTFQELRRGSLCSKRIERSSCRGQRIARQVNPVEVFVVLAAVLQVIVDLKSGAERVGRRPGGRAFAVN